VSLPAAAGRRPAGRPDRRPGDGHVEVLELRAAPRREGILDIDRLMDALGPCDLLESADRSGWSYLVPHDLARGRLVDDGSRARWIDADGTCEDLGADPLEAIDTVARRAGLDPCAEPASGVAVPFTGGLVGALSYELGARIAPRVRPRGGPRHPGFALRLTGALVAVPRERDRALVVVDTSIHPSTPRDVREDLERRCRTVGPTDPRHPRHGAGTGPVTSSLPHAAHVAAIGAVQERIGAGDTYQVNIAQRLEGRWDGDVVTLYRWLRAASPASHAAMLPDLGLASISPERFLGVHAGRVVTEPIKGTRPRSDDPLLDAALADDLATSSKDRAENVMVVDLERNDLGRVCVAGSVHVPVLLELRALPTVWHLVSRVEGELLPDTTYGELLRATFPSGSVTGAPRLAAMQLIRELEPVPRGWYCGAVGYLGRGSAALSVAIRTATLGADGGVTYGAGGGIVADSVPDDEVAESLDKALPFLRALRAVDVRVDA
jgi:para-aminobenzoate synthetase component I